MFLPMSIKLLCPTVIRNESSETPMELESKQVFYTGFLCQSYGTLMNL